MGCDCDAVTLAAYVYLHTAVVEATVTVSS